MRKDGFVLFDAVRNNCVSNVQLLLNFGGFRTGTRDELGRTPLHFAAGKGCLYEMLELLVNRTKNVNMYDIYGLSPLHSAAAANDINKVNLLLKAGANPNALTKDRMTPLLDSIEKGGNLDVVRALIKAGADVNLADSFKSTALHFAVIYGNVPVTKELIKAGASLDVKDLNGQTPLDIALEAQNEVLVKILVAAKTE